MRIAVFSSLYRRQQSISAVNFPTESHLRRFSSSPCEHVPFIKDVAATRPPENLPYLLNILRKRGDSIITPGDKHGLIPLVIPLSRNCSGAITALLRWPTAPSGKDMPVVEVHKYGVWLLAKNIDLYINRLLVEEDARNLNRNSELFYDSTKDGMKFYQEGNFAKSQIPNMDTYLLRKVGLFPDVLERKVKQLLSNKDHVSALVTGEFYARKEHFPGFGRPFAFNAEILLKIGRDLEAKDAARGALKLPWWTLGYWYHEVAEIAQWKDEQIRHVKKKLTEEGKQEDLDKGKEPAQRALDEAAFWLDLASIDGSWDNVVDRIAECYKVAGLDDMAKFVSFNG